MILANVRQHLTRDDAQLALRLIARGSSEAIEDGETVLRDEGIDALLDDPRLLAGIMSARQGAHTSLPLFAYVVVRHALREVGEGDRMLADYLASILLHFGLGSASTIDLIEVRWPSGKSETHTGLPVRKLIRITEGQAAHEVLEPRP